MRRGDLLPRMRTPPPGPESLRLCRLLERFEAPGINTLAGGEPSLLWAEARGANVLDVDGNRYIDLTAGFGVAAVGHRHPAVVAAIRHQARRLLHALADVHAHPLRVELARHLTALAPVDTPQVYFAVSGADAVEVALKSACLATARPGIVAFEPAYHGLTLGALAVTSRPEFRRPFAAHLHNHVWRLPYAAAPREVEALLAREREIGGVVVEPVAGREGVLLPPPGWLSSLAEICRRRGVVLIADEILTGLGRSGEWFAVDAEEVRPDLLCCGKSLGGGLPIAAVIGRAPLLAAWRTPGEALHTATFVAHPVACAAALAALQILEEQDLPGRARRLGAWLGQRLEVWPSRFRDVVEVRGRGLLWGIELTSAEAAKDTLRSLLQRGLLLAAGGPEGRVLQLTPPLTITEAQLETAVSLLEEALGGEGLRAWRLKG